MQYSAHQLVHYCAGDVYKNSNVTDARGVTRILKSTSAAAQQSCIEENKESLRPDCGKQHGYAYGESSEAYGGHKCKPAYYASIEDPLET